MRKMINVFRQEVAEQIVNELGCKYMTKDLGDAQVFCFVDSDKLHKYIKKNFSKKDWFYDNKVFL